MIARASPDSEGQGRHGSAPSYWIGTSGYNYPEWKGSFYPADLASAKMLPYYAERFRTVEINYTFYRMPTEKLLAGWAAATPDGFTFTLKAPRRITHDARLERCDDLVKAFCGAAFTLEDRLGCVLFQLPPSLRRNTDVLDAFVAMLPRNLRAAFEFRHASWHDGDVYDRLRDRNLALCIADSERMSTPLEMTADYGYFRLRDEGYTDRDIVDWAGRIAAAAGDRSSVFVYFKHEEKGKGPEFARLLAGTLVPGR